jgi:ABC-type nickel/cobalt efflux system permease component RcnA
MLLATAFTLIICTLLYFIAGMINPSWAVFWMHKPSRILVLFITTIMLMGSLTLYGEAHKRRVESEKSITMQQEKTEATTD